MADVDLTTLGAPITANGDYSLDVNPGDEVVVEVDGTFGGRTVSPVWKSIAGNWNPVKDLADEVISKTEAFILRITAGRTGKVGIQVTGAGNAPDLRVGWSSISRRPGAEISAELPAGV